MHAALSVLLLCGSFTLSAQTPTQINQHQHVVATQDNHDGTTTVTEWTPAPDFSPQELYRRLRAQGTPGLADPGATDDASAQLSATEADCSIQGSYALQQRCGTNRIHWTGSHPVVYFLDHTSSQWPVYSAASVWNQSTSIDVGYRWYTNGCPGGAHCVHVYDAYYGATGWTGATSYTYNTNTLAFVEGSVVSKFNDTYSYSSKELQQTACHELGHALALGHNLYTSSCLYFETTDSASRYPADGDFSMLASIY